MAQILFPIFDQVIFAPINSTRATPMRDLLAAAASTGTPAYAASSVNQAIELAFEHASAHPSSPVVVSGSVYLVGDIRTRLLARTAPAGIPSPTPERVGQLP
jgi:dihydrofolate synthase/folylpolyglutamate synthase